MRWFALLWGAAMLAFLIGTLWFSLERGRLVYSGARHITRKDQPIRFWIGIGYAAAACFMLTAIVGYAFFNASRPTS